MPGNEGLFWRRPNGDGGPALARVSRRAAGGRERVQGVAWIGCDLCGRWHHNKCVALSLDEVAALEATEEKWECPTCIAKSCAAACTLPPCCSSHNPETAQSSMTARRGRGGPAGGLRACCFTAHCITCTLFSGQQTFVRGHGAEVEVCWGWA